MRYCILSTEKKLQFVAMPDSYMYQLVALLRRLHKEIDKLTISDRPILPIPVAECADLEVHAENVHVLQGIDYLAGLEQQFANLKEENYPLISLLTEIRALHAQLEYLIEEDEYE
ncbi:hydrolase/acyltransferase [Aneurinibacillus sp. REN35]|uniref:hydrolase/acyltransferase n=1 Tax=Aneurinibacillus sp. REN35 TaxID=3237286 RepID=UPI0035276912